jgi:MerR family copper efflux transcriptional regulator
MATAGGLQRYQIGTVAEMTGLSIQTLRHWDEVGLVPPSERSEGGFRLYSDVDVQRLLVIRRMKPLEFTLEEMGRLLRSIDVLAEAGSAASERMAAVEYIGECHRRAMDAIHRLRRRLAYAEEFTEMLAHQADLGLGAAAAHSQVGESPSEG